MAVLLAWPFRVLWGRDPQDQLACERSTIYYSALPAGRFMSGCICMRVADVSETLQNSQYGHDVLDYYCPSQMQGFVKEALYYTIVHYLQVDP